MNRHLDFFDPAVPATLQQVLTEAYARGARKVLVSGADNRNTGLRRMLHSTGFTTLVGRRISDIKPINISNSDLLVINDGSSTAVSRVLHACIGKMIGVIAPITDHHISKRTVFLMAIPKAGTHMLIRLFGLMGLERSLDRAPRQGSWCTPVGWEYHAPCHELVAKDFSHPLGRQLFFRSPAIFVYRNPLDILVSELDWFVKPEHLFSGYLNSFKNDRERLFRLIADDSVMGNIRDRINRYAGWMNFSNVIPVSYEELVGASGGGDNTRQADSIWALQLKLHIAGCPEDFGRQLYDPGSATFMNGEIGRHRECFTDKHWTAFDTLPQDFMRALGYSKDSLVSSKVDELLNRRLLVKQLSNNQLYVPRMVRANLQGWNIVEIAGQYYPVKLGHRIDSPGAGKDFAHNHEGFMTDADAAGFIVNNYTSQFVYDAPSQGTDTFLEIENYFGFNIIRHNKCWYGIAQAVGPLDLASLDAPAFESMRIKGQCVTGENITEIKAGILKQELQAHIDAAQLRFATELKVVREQVRSVQEQDEIAIAHVREQVRSVREQDEIAIAQVQEQVRSVREQDEIAIAQVREQVRSVQEQDEIAIAHGAETDRQLDAMWKQIDELELQAGTELKSVQEQLGRIVNNPFVRMSQLMYRSLRSAYRLVFRGKH